MAPPLTSATATSCAISSNFLPSPAQHPICHRPPYARGFPLLSCFYTRNSVFVQSLFILAKISSLHPGLLWLLISQLRSPPDRTQQCNGRTVRSLFPLSTNILGDEIKKSLGSSGSVCLGGVGRLYAEAGFTRLPLVYRPAWGDISTWTSDGRCGLTAVVRGRAVSVGVLHRQ